MRNIKSTSVLSSLASKLYSLGCRCRYFLFLSVLLLMVPRSISAQVVDIPDPNLRAEIALELGKAPEAPLTHAEMETLVGLSASSSDITDLRGIEFAINLTRLNLYVNKISDLSPLARLTNLTDLTLSDNFGLSDLSPLAGLTNLTRLNIGATFDLSDLSPLAGLTNLESLSLYINKISDLSPLAGLTNLRYLNLRSNNISDIETLAGLTNLTRLDLRSNNISDIETLAGLTNLTRLDLRSNNISDIETLERFMAQGTVVLFSDTPAFETPGPKIENGWVWLIVPATDVDAAVFGRDYLLDASGGTVTEAAVAVKGASAGTRVGTRVWTAASLDATDGNNLNAIVRDYNLETDILPYLPVAYGVVSIESETQQQTRLYIGGGRVKVWLNGTLVYKDTVGRNYIANYETAVPVQLNPGKNLLFIAAIDRNWSQWSVFFGFQDGTFPVEPPPGGVFFDINGDGLVNILDLVFVASNFGHVGENTADVNNDGIVNIIDLTLVAGAIGGGATSPSIWGRDLEIAPTREQAQQWLHEARQMNLTDPAFQRGILILEQLLAALTPKETVLLPNYPNPFNPETWIPYQLSAPADVSISIYAADGRLVRTLDLGHQSVGIYESRSRAAYWDGRNALGERVASGVYFYTLTAGDFAATRKMLIKK